MRIYSSIITLLCVFFISSVNIASDDSISIFDTGPGMDGSDENSIVKWCVISVFLHNFQDYCSANDFPLFLAKTESLGALKDGWANFRYKL